MSTYYGYAEREAEDNINWSTVGNDITKMLKEEVERRETLKSDIDKATREYGETLANAPTGTHKGANDFITRFSDDATQAMLMQDRLLKSGQLKVKDYLLQRANLKDGTKNIFGVAKKFQAEFKRKAERMTKDESAKLEQTLFKLTEGFANFNNSGAYINPTNYSVSLAKKERVQDKDGNYVYQMSKKPQDFFTVSELNTFVSLDLDRFDTEGAMNKFAEAAGARDQSIRYYDKETDSFIDVFISDVSGDVYNKNLSDSQKKLVDGYKKAEEDAIEDILSNPYNAASILTDYVGKGYDFTFDPTEANKNDKMILLEKDPGGSGIPKVVLSGTQEKVIKETLSRGIKFRLDQKYIEKGVEKKRFAPRSKTPEDRKEDTTKGKIDNSIFISDLIYGNEAQKTEALNRLKSLNRKGVKQYRFVQTDEKDKNGNLITNLVVDIPDKNTQSGFSTESVIEDFNNKGVDQIVRSLIFDDITNILTEEDRKFYKDNMSSVILDNFSDYGLKSSQLVPVGANIQSSRTKPALVSWPDRTVVAASGVTGNPQVVFNEQAKTEATTDNAKGLVTTIELSYLGVPKGQTSEIVPLSGVVELSPLSKADVVSLGIKGTAYETLEIKLDPKFSDDEVILIPVWDSTFESTNKVMKYMEDIASKIKSGQKTEKISIKKAREFFTETNYGKDDIEWFDEYNKFTPTTTAKTKKKSTPISD